MNPPSTIMEIAETLAARTETTYAAAGQYSYPVNSHPDPLSQRAALVLTMLMERCPGTVADIDAELTERDAAGRKRQAAHKAEYMSAMQAAFSATPGLSGA